MTAFDPRLIGVLTVLTSADGTTPENTITDIVRALGGETGAEQMSYDDVSLLLTNSVKLNLALLQSIGELSGRGKDAVTELLQAIATIQ